MANLTVYLSAEIEKRVRARAQAEGSTVNKWIAATLASVVQQTWSPEFLAAAGGDTAFPEVRESVFGTDTRETLA